MSLIVYNGSPRGKESNSSQIVNWFLDGYGSAEICYLKQIKQHRKFVEESKEYEEILFVFPLYADGMPAQVKDFIEIMYADKEEFIDKKVAFVIHSGFSEGIHCQNLSRYLKRLSEKMQMKSFGVVIIPGSEGFRLMPPAMTRKKREQLAVLGTAFRRNERFDERILSQLQGPLVMPVYKKLLFGIFRLLGLTNMYWDRQLKRNNAFDRRFDAPYA